jgi:hypothetical protein
VRTFSSLTVGVEKCTQELVDAVKASYITFLKAQPGVVAASVSVDVTCTEAVSCRRGAHGVVGDGWVECSCMQRGLQCVQ